MITSELVVVKAGFLPPTLTLGTIWGRRWCLGTTPAGIGPLTNKDSDHRIVFTGDGWLEVGQALWRLCSKTRG